MRVKSGTMPQSFEVRNVGTKAFVSFAENVTERDIEEGKEYEYDSYVMETTAGAGLETRVHDNYEKWLAKAKASTPEPEPTSDEVLSDLIEVLIDKGVIF